MLRPRLLTPADIPAAMRLKEAAGWNQTETDWRNVLQLAPEGCFAIDSDGALVATATAVCFGQGLAWIGMVLTDPAYRGRGFARVLMEHALDYLAARRVQWIKLDATDMGRPLYTRLGFRDECAVERWMRPVRETPRRVVAAPASGPADFVLDREAFGADRSRLLETLAPIESVCSSGAFAMGRPGAKATYFGPCVSRSAGTVRDLIAGFLARHADENVCWDILPEKNAEAVAIAQEYGFERARQLVRMAIAQPGAQPFRGNDELIFGTAGFEYG